MDIEQLDEKAQFNEDYAEFVNEEFKRRQSERTPYELTWRLIIEFIKGNQFLSINPTMKKIDEIPKLYDWQEKEVFNQMATIVETRISRLSRQKPLLKTRPSSKQEDDLQSAKISTNLLSNVWHDEKMDDKYADSITWLEFTGSVLTKNIWNPDKGRKIGTMQAPSDDETQAPGEIEVHEGDIETSVVSPFEFYPDSNTRNGLEECRSVIHAKAFHVKDIEDMYGVSVDEEKIDAYALQAGNGLSGMTYNAGSYTLKNENLKNHALVKEYYERPSRKHPNGRLIIVVGDKTLYAGELPYKIGDDGTRDLPFVLTVANKIPNVFWGQCVAERCIPVQRRYNALRNRKQEYLNLVAIGQWYEPIGSLDDDSELTNEPGNRIRHNPGLRPEPVSFPSLPGSFENEEQTLLSEFTAISGVSELSRYSEAPSGVKSGVALSIANEQDDTRIALTAGRIANGTVQTGKHWLRLYKQYANEPRIARAVGKDVDVQEWTASDLRGDDIIVENSSALSETPAQRRQMVFDLIGSGIFNRPETNPFTPEAANKILELIEIGHWEAGVDNIRQLHENKADRENRFVEQGMIPQVHDYDDHEIHLLEHLKFRLQPDYQDMLQTPQGQMIDQALAMHVQQHQQYLAQMQYNQMIAQMQGQHPQPAG